MTYIVDASVAVKWFVRENLHDQALLLLDHGDLLQAPDLVVPEVANIAWKKCIRGEIPDLQARAIATAMRQYIPTLHPSAGLVERALDIALTLNHPVYDCLYLACAEEAAGPLITADERLYETIQGTEFAPLVRHLENPDFLTAEHPAPA